MIWISKRWDADWVSSSWYGKNGGYVQWAKKYNVKQFAESILFLQQHAIHDKKTLDALVDGSSAKYHELMKTIKDAEEKMAANKVIKTHIINYAKTRETYITYRKSGYSKKFLEAHRDEIILCCSAELGHRGRHEKETAAGKISMRAIIKNINWRLPSFLYSGRAGMYQHSQSEGAAWHRR